MVSTVIVTSSVEKVAKQLISGPVFHMTKSPENTVYEVSMSDKGSILGGSEDIYRVFDEETWNAIYIKNYGMYRSPPNPSQIRGVWFKRTVARRMMDISNNPPIGSILPIKARDNLDHLMRVFGTPLLWFFLESNPPVFREYFIPEEYVCIATLLIREIVEFTDEVVSIINPNASPYTTDINSTKFGEDTIYFTPPDGENPGNYLPVPIRSKPYYSRGCVDCKPELKFETIVSLMDSIIWFHDILDPSAPQPMDSEVIKEYEDIMAVERYVVSNRSVDYALDVFPENLINRIMETISNGNIFGAVMSMIFIDKSSLVSFMGSSTSELLYSIYMSQITGKITYDFSLIYNLIYTLFPEGLNIDTNNATDSENLKHLKAIINTVPDKPNEIITRWGTCHMSRLYTMINNKWTLF